MPLNKTLPWSHAVSVDPTVEPVTVQEAKRNSDVDDDARDADFSRWIVEARKKVERDSRRALVNQTHVLKLDEFPNADYIVLPFPPLSSVTSIQYVDTAGTTQTFSSGSYTVDTNRTPGIVHLNYNESWPAIQGIFNSVVVTYVAGYGSTAADVPESAKAAILLLVKQRYEFPDSGEEPMGYQALLGDLVYGSYP